MDTVSKAIVASAVIVALALIVAADFLKSPYQIAAAGVGGGIYRLNEITGEVVACNLDSDEISSAIDAKAGAALHCDVPKKTTEP